MRLLYGVQATGNGHISRARAMAAEFKLHGASVDFLFSGRAADALFDMECFGNFSWRRGLTFVSHAGKLSYWQSLQQANLKQLWRDQQQLDTRCYDAVLTDFEPVTAWAARRQGTPCIALGHQYAFLQDIPKKDDSLLSRQIFRHFAPAETQLGLHWHHFGSPSTIAPPILDLSTEYLRAAQHSDKNGRVVLVYLPFEDQQQVRAWLKPLQNYRFDIYAPGLDAGQQGHLQFHPLSHSAFKQHLARADAVLSNAGFELISEALQLQKKIMVKPLRGQMEQASNALALHQLQLAQQTDMLSTETIAAWLQGPSALQQVQYPDVAAALCQQIVSAKLHEIQQQGWQFDTRQLWQQSKFLQPSLLP